MPRTLSSWIVILVATLVGPVPGVLLFTLPVTLKMGFGKLDVLMTAFYRFGLIPAFVGGVLFVLLRPHLGSGYRCAALCGFLSVAACIFLPQQLGLPLSAPRGGQIGAAVIFGIILGCPSAMAVRLLVSPWMPSASRP